MVEADRLRVVAPPPLIYALGFLAGYALERALHLPLPRARWPGLALAVAGVALMLWAAATMVRARTTFNPYGRAEALVAHGPFAWSRNPIYLADVLVYVGLALVWGLGWAFVLLPVVLVVMHVGVIRREEAHLAARFGDDYARYRARVRRWL